MFVQRSGRIAAVAALVIAAAGCSGGGGNDTGTLNLALTDGPVDGADNVVIAFTGIQLKPSGGPAMDPIPMDSDSCDTWDSTSGVCQIDLLDLVGTDRRQVFSRELPAGHYEWVRLLVKAERNTVDSYINRDGMQCSLWIPSGNETGLKIVSGITVTANGVSDYTLDFDVRKSITNPPGLAGPPTLDMCAEEYVLKPAIRIVDTTEVGHIAGTVAESLLAADASCDDTSGRYENVAAYVFEDKPGYVADDLDGDDGDAITSATVAWDDALMAYSYEVGYLLAPATYHVAVTCTADVDVATTDDLPADPQVFGFVAERSVDVMVGQTADGSIPPP